MTVRKIKIAIIGAGPTGLGAAWRLTELGETDWIIIESANGPGGLAGSLVDNQGFVWDQGGHVLFSHYDYFDQALDACMGDDWVQHVREAWVWLRNQFIPYPLQNNIWRLPKPDLLDCLHGLLSIHNKAAVPLSGNVFEDWILQNFGQGLAEVFFLPYNYKVWAYPPKRLSACWIQDRVATVDLGRILENMVMRQDDPAWGPNSTFRFPLRGGTGEIWRRVADRLPADHKITACAVTSLKPDRRQLELADGSTIEYQHLLSSAPLPLLLRMIEGQPELTKMADRFLYSSTNLVGIGLEGKTPDSLRTKNWIYFVEDQFPFYRITVFSNYSKFNVPRPGEQWSLLCEVSESREKPVDQSQLQTQVVDALKQIGLLTDTDKIVSLWQKRLEYGYPTPFVDRDAVLEPINKALCELGIFSRGRFGAWKYEVSNQDHSFMQGVEAIDYLLSGSEETTYHHPAVVNSGKRLSNSCPS